ncbi:MAG: hypothetical protein KBG48_11750 [Kofleriaceae bacterium]|nr:hypothetical protein [Kofleriaceae bacterium]MBP9168060.1 hypothetical protein [Kofleriaceae bacterium]
MIPLAATLEGPTALTGISIAKSIKPFCDAPPEKVWVDDEPAAPDAWPTELLRAHIKGIAFWPNYRTQVSYLPRSEQIGVFDTSPFTTLTEALRTLEAFDFEILCGGAAFFDEWLAADYKRWGFGRSHIDNGWGCAFRGRGHDRLVSRRWLDFGPWRVIRRPNDTTFIQFHDLALTDPAEAYAQAAPGLKRMGNDPTGGHIGFHKERMIASAGKGLYSPGQRLLEVVVGPGNEVRQGDMLCNCALRLHHKETQPATGRIERIAYVFVDEGDARAHLHELWLRELECWVADDRGKRRLDLDYHPVPSPPAWVRDLEAREATT